jgi:putative transposase
VGEERIAAELLLKLGLRVSPRTVRRYMPPGAMPRRRPGVQDWSTFVRNHVRGSLACDFFVVVTATFRVCYVFVVLEVGTRRILHLNVRTTLDWRELGPHGHRIPDGHEVVWTPVLGGLHHEYRLQPAA